MEGTLKPDYVEIGFGKLEGDLKFLIDCLGEVLTELGHGDMAAWLPWSDKPHPADGKLPPQIGLVYSIAFQLLNMVEENSAAAMRVLREESEGLSAEHGLWGRVLASLKKSGTSESDIATVLAQVRVEPVLTAHPTACFTTSSNNGKRTSPLPHCNRCANKRKPRSNASGAQAKSC